MICHSPENAIHPGLPDERWMKAAVAGGLWAAFEIIIGSFLHNLRIPFAGSILSAFAVMLMVAFHRLWPLKGLIWRAGLICALMKSISPSALILGPMIGIMSEAVLIELSLRIIGSNKAGYLVGGILGVCSALIHKVVSILILYGSDIIEVYLNIYRFAVRQLGVPDADPWLVVFALIGVYVSVGIVAAAIGISIPLDGKSSPSLSFQEEKASQLSPFSVSANSYSLTLLLLHLISVPVLILMIVKAGLPAGAIAVTAWATVLSFKYPGVFRRFSKPVLWFQFLVIIFIAAFFWERQCAYFICFSVEGLEAGLTMTLRAAVVIMAFSAFSIELRNPVVRIFLEKKGMRNLYLGISVAFSALPFMVAQIPDARTLVRHPRSAIARAMLNAQYWLQHLKNEEPGVKANDK
jgi:hypothetical protein